MVVRDGGKSLLWWLEIEDGRHGLKKKEGKRKLIFVIFVYL